VGHDPVQDTGVPKSDLRHTPRICRIVPSLACSRPRKADNGNLDKLLNAAENGKERGDETVVRAAAGKIGRRRHQPPMRQLQTVESRPSTAVRVPSLLHSPLGRMLPHRQQRQCASSTKPSCHQPLKWTMQNWPCLRIPSGTSCAPPKPPSSWERLECIPLLHRSSSARQSPLNAARWG
jgi:hypothetical protein